jgi:MFS family permease
MVNHLCLGSIFAWSLFNKPLTSLEGVLAPAASDWALSDVSVTFSLVMGGFVWGALLSKRLEEWGPRASCLMGAACLGGGFGLAAAAAEFQSLPLLLGGGAIWGLANGLAYVPPVAMLLQWYPTRRGFAGAACLVGYGGGALLAAPLFSNLLHYFRQAPQRLADLDSALLECRDGKLFVGAQEVVAAASADVQSWPGLQEGLYAVGTGSTGGTG